MRALDLRGKVFGELQAIEVVTTGKKRVWRCQCSCGVSCEYVTFQLTAGNAKTCGIKLNHTSIKVGDRFGKLVVTEIYRDTKNRRFMTKCLCDCGKVKENVSFKNIQRGLATHCGCSRKRQQRRLAKGVAAKNKIIGSYRSNARHKKICFKLNNEDCERLFKGNCYLCGSPPPRKTNYKKVGSQYTYNGIDRIDSLLGYTRDNTLSCCTKCNFLKGNTVLKDFLYHIRQIYKNTSQQEG